MVTLINKYKGSPVIALMKDINAPDYYRFSFGVLKARLILDNIEDIKKFVEENEVK